MNYETRKKYLKAFEILWITANGIIFIVLLIPFFVSRETLGNIIPGCTYAESGRICFFCGMTEAFYEISRFELKKAAKANVFSLFIYFIFISNTISFIFIMLKRISEKLINRMP